MSTRALRKLHGEVIDIKPSLEKDQNDSESSDESDSASGHGHGRISKHMRKINSPAINPFELLNEDEVNLDDNDESENENERKQEVPREEVIVKSSKNKKKKKKKKKNSPQENKNDCSGGVDDIEASIQEVNKMLGTSHENQETSKNEYSAPSKLMLSLLTVEHKHLNPENEMKRIFGSRIVQNETGSRRRGRGRTIQRNYLLVQRKDTWPPLSKLGLNMTLKDSSNVCQNFVYEHAPSYRSAQCLFWDAVNSYNPQNIVDLLHVYPYHVDSLIQLSEVCKINGDLQMATDLIERALHAFECSFHTLFNVTQGTCRLDYRYQENRALFIALFKHIGFIGQRGCNRTALELCKLLLSLDPESDPMGALLMIDSYALRSEQYLYLIRMFYDWERSRNLSQLPNFAFSVALAMFKQAIIDATPQEEADKMLQQALISYPGLLMPLLDKCSIAPDSEVLKHPYFGTETQLKQPEALKQLAALYIGRCHNCWKEPEVMTWLETNVKVTLARVNSGDKTVKQIEAEKKNRYKGMPRNISRHILISEIKEAMTELPPEIANTAVLSYDPLPPPDGVVSYTQPPRRRQVDSHSNALSMFFRSLMPNFNPQEVVDDSLEGAEGGGPPANLREGVGNLMEAMRNLLQNIQPVEPPLENNNNNDDNQADDNQPPQPPPLD